MEKPSVSVPESRRGFLKKLTAGALALNAIGPQAFVQAHAAGRATAPSPNETVVEDIVAGGDCWNSLADPGWGA